MVSYSFNVFDKVGIDPDLSAVYFAIDHCFLPAVDAGLFAEWLMTFKNIDVSPDLLTVDCKEDALNALSDLGNIDEHRGCYVFRYAALASLESSGQELLDEIESIYSDFNYPEDMEPFIYYMPNDFVTNSAEDLIERFNKFLAVERKRLGLQ